MSVLHFRYIDDIFTIYGYLKTKKTTSKQLYIANLQIIKHFYTLNEDTQDL